MNRAHKSHLHSKGIGLILGATLFVAAGDALAKWLLQTYPVLQFICIRSTCGLVIILLYLVAAGKLHELRTRRLRWHMLRAVLVAFVMIAIFYALANIPMVEVEAIGHAAPFFVAVVSPVMLKERVTGHNWFAIALGFIGVLIILRPDPSHFHVAHVVVLGGALGYALLILLARMLSATDTIFAISFYIYPLTAAATGFASYGTWMPPAIGDWLLFLACALVLTVAVLMFIAGVKHVDATLAATLDYVTLIWVALLGFIFWHEIPDPVTFAGIVLIVSSGIYIVRHSTRRIDESLVQTSDH